MDEVEFFNKIFDIATCNDLQVESDLKRQVPTLNFFSPKGLPIQIYCESGEIEISTPTCSEFHWHYDTAIRSIIFLIHCY